MAYPKIVYNTTTLLFSFPPVDKPGANELVAERHDSYSTSGLKQSVWERTDEYLELQMKFVPQTDLAAWTAFLQWALQGNSFYYYPDADVDSFTTFTLDDTSWKPGFNFKTISKFTLRMRKV